MPWRILIVDDDPTIQAAFRRLFNDQGFVVEQVTDGHQAMQAIERDPPDLLLTDCFLPRMDGVHLCKFLRADPRFRTLPLILMSGRLDQELLDLCRSFGIDAAFEKTVPTDTLLREVQRLLAH
ncbi:MAG: response regulator [Deltaproteobacteria bacterium]|nr:response regulator [Deltaproteobacteria bacterium]